MTASTKRTLLITGGGGAGTIAVIQSLKALGYEVYAADATAHSAGLSIADRGFVVPFAVDPAFLDAMREVLRATDPDYLVPTVDEEIVLLHDLVSREFPRTRVLAPRPAFCRQMLDKYRMYEALTAAGLRVARSWLANDASSCTYPAIVKPRVGRGSRGLAYLDSAADLEDYLRGASSGADHYVVQERGFGAEYTTSVVVALDNTLLSIVPKEVVSKKGITQVGVTRKSTSIDVLCRGIATKLEPYGPFNVQLMLDKDDSPLVFEINPRYSTTVALTLEAGVNEVDEVVRRFLGLPAGQLDFEPDLMMIRYPTQLYVRERDWRPTVAGKR